MPKATGLNFLLYVWDGVSVWLKLAGQTSGDFNRSTEAADARDKDGDGWPDELPTGRTWSFDVSGNLDEADPAFLALETHFENLTNPLVRFTTPAGNNYDGIARIADMNTSGPQDDMMTYSVSLAGAGSLAKS